MFIFRQARGAIAAALLLPALSYCALSVAQSEQAAPVRAEAVKQQTIQRVAQLTGTVTSARSAMLSTATSGLVTTLHVDAGSKVTAGDVLLELDAALAQWQWRSAQASAETARVALADSQRRLEEARTLVKQFTVSESAVRDLEAEVAQDKAELQRAEAESGYRKGIFDRHQLYAPFTGIVSSKQTELGEWVDPGESVLTLVATEDLRMDFPVAEDYLSEVTMATPVTYSLANNPTEVRAGKIITVVPITDPGARTFLLRIQSSEPDTRMSPGMSARAELSLDAGHQGLTVPRDAILKFPDGRVIVWVVNGEDNSATVTETRVSTGAEFDGTIEVLEGLQPGARVVVQGNERLQTGQRVTLLPPNSR